MSMKTFTLQEAQTLLPVIEALLKRAQAAKARAEALDEDQRQLQQRIIMAGGMFIDVATAARSRAERDVAVQQARDAFGEIDSIGVQVKDMDSGLLDFPCQLDGTVVLLCWKMGEEEITHWHTIEAGFEGRKPIDDRFRTSKRERPN